MFSEALDMPGIGLGIVEISSQQDKFLPYWERQKDHVMMNAIKVPPPLYHLALECPWLSPWFFSFCLGQIYHLYAEDSNTCLQPCCSPAASLIPDGV